MYTAYEGIELPDAYTNDVMNEKLKQYKENKDLRNEIIIHNVRYIIKYIYSNFMPNQNNFDDIVSVGAIGFIKALDHYDFNGGFYGFANVCMRNEVFMYLKKEKINKEAAKKYCDTFHKNKGFQLYSRDVLDIYLEMEEKEELKKVLEGIDARKRELIKLKYGFYDEEKHSQQELAKKFDISQSYASREMNRGLKEVKTKLLKRDQIYCKKRG